MCEILNCYQVPLFICEVISVGDNRVSDISTEVNEKQKCMENDFRNNKAATETAAAATP